MKNSLIIKCVILGSVTALFAFFVFIINTSDSIKNNLLFRFPIVIDDVSGRDIQMEDWVFTSLETPYAIMRNYTNADGTAINLAIVWYDDKEIAFHSAAACLGGTGNQVKEDKQVTLSSNTGESTSIGRIITDKGNLRRLVYYYYVSDGFITGDQIKLRMNVIKKRIQFRRTSAAFIRLMITVHPDVNFAEVKLKSFFEATLPYVKYYTDTKNILKSEDNQND